MATPLLLVLVVVEATDVVFAVDSIPAVFGVTTDPFIVFTSNIFAILGLRALYFLLAGLMHKFRYLNYGLGLVLVFVGAKMLAETGSRSPTGRSRWRSSWAFLAIGDRRLARARRAPRGGDPARPRREREEDFAASGGAGDRPTSARRRGDAGVADRIPVGN